MSRKAETPPEILQQVPVRTREWESSEDGLVRVLLPRYGDSALGRWIARKVRRPHIELHLDDVGSRIWLSCDGKRRADEIAGILSGKFGQRVEPVGERLSTFLRQLRRSGCIRWRNPAENRSTR